MVSFALSVSLAVCEHFKRGGASDGHTRGALEQVVWTLRKFPNPNAKTLEMSEDTIVDMF
jgi:hypothetical protein